MSDFNFNLGLSPEIDLSCTSHISAYDVALHAPREVLVRLPDGHQLVRSLDGWLYSMRMVTDSHGREKSDKHGSFCFMRHLGETDDELIKRWRHEAQRGAC